MQGTIINGILSFFLMPMLPIELAQAHHARRVQKNFISNLKLTLDPLPPVVLLYKPRPSQKGDKDLR